MATTVADAPRARVPAQGTARPRTRWFYTGMGGVAVLVVIVGFSGPMPGDVPGPRAFSSVVRLHGAVFGAWLALFIAQAGLVATGARPCTGDSVAQRRCWPL
jgi:hypothetical protein